MWQNHASPYKVIHLKGANISEVPENGELMAKCEEYNAWPLQTYRKHSRHTDTYLPSKVHFLEMGFCMHPNMIILAPYIHGNVVAWNQHEKAFWFFFQLFFPWSKLKESIHISFNVTLQPMLALSLTFLA